MKKNSSRAPRKIYFRSLPKLSSGKSRYFIITLMLVMILMAYDMESSPVSQERKTAPELLRLDGSTTLEKPFAEIVASYGRIYPEMTLVNSASSSSNGIINLLSGKADIARSSRALTIKDQATTLGYGIILQQVLIGIDEIVVIIHPEKERWLKHITMEQIRNIFYNGTITSWKQLLPWLEGEINVYARDSQLSGTAYTFTTKVTGEGSVPFVRTATYVDSNPKIRAAVAQDVNGIAFLPAEMLDDGVMSLQIDAEKSSFNNVHVRVENTRKTPLLRPLYLVVAKPLTAPVAGFLAFVKGKEATEILRRYNISPAK